MEGNRGEKMSKITVTKIETLYGVDFNNGEFLINLRINECGQSTITTARGNEEFIFKNSDPATIEVIGKLLVKAAEITRENI
jgi:hypothetical protein